MPALTHGRVKNGFTGGIRYKKNSKSSISRRVGNTAGKKSTGDNKNKNGGSAISKATVGGVGSKSISNRSAIQRRTNNGNDNNNNCCTKPQKTIPRVGQESVIRRRV